jgi:4-hydroxy-3-methylbut-2-en-1-yl diphosphate synthase IspG/GcpE
MYSLCPLCNQFESTMITCPTCLHTMHDLGRVSDYFDDYSPYEDIDGLKQVDGYETDLKEHKCPHYFSCPTCHKNKVFLIEEWLT